jgi:predicted O-methyltransferase YrrM
MPAFLKKLARRNNFLFLLYNLPKLCKGYFPILLDYPIHPQPRYGYGRPPHAELYEMFSAQRASFRQLLLSFLEFEPSLARIARHQPDNSPEPCWENNWFSGLDTVALYSLIALNKPSKCIEVGSGQSTKVMRRAIRDHSPKSRLTSIDPRPRAEIDALCDRIIRQRLEEVDLKIFQELKAGDLLFIDSSHRSFMNSDVTVFFLEVLPRLAAGVLVHLHDIHLPYDYPPERAGWYYSEQYLLAASLLAGHRGYEIVLPNAFVSDDADLRPEADGLWKRLGLRSENMVGLSFWLRINRQ